MATLKAQHLAKSYKGRQVVRDVSMSIDSGQIVGLLGPNGAGKTTTVKAVMGLVPRTGSIRMSGAEISSLSTHLVVRHGIGYAPEDRGIFAGLTVAENLRLAEREVRGGAEAGEPN